MINNAFRQPDGKWLIAGDFTTVHGAVRGRVARLNRDGSTDASFGNGLAGASRTTPVCGWPKPISAESSSRFVSSTPLK